MLISLSLSLSLSLPSPLQGIRLLSSHGQTDAMEAIALGHLSQEIDVYSNSWGPTDNGALVDGPGPLTRDVLKAGVEKVRSSSDDVIITVTENRSGIWL